MSVMGRSICSLKAICKPRVFDPLEPFIQKWNKIILVLCAFTVAWDALFFYIPVVDGENNCLRADITLEIIASVVRTFIDLFYLGHIILQFSTGYISPDSRGFGRGDPVMKLKSIATRYLKSYFIVDVLAVLPLPQILVLIPRLGWPWSNSKDLLTLVIFIQYVPRFFRVYPLYKEVMRTSGVVTGRSWAGAVLNLLLYVLASHVIGAVWYLFSIDRLNTCWHESCIGHGCLHLHTSIYCNNNPVKDYTFNKTYCSHLDPDQVKSLMVFDFGMFCEALQSEVVQSHKFFKKISLCFWWGLRNLSSYGQNFNASNYVGENLFATFICISGLLLFSFLFGNIQKYLNSATAKVEEMRSKWHDTEKWMSHRALTDDLKKRIRKYELYKWQDTRGVNEDTVISELPRDLRVDIKRHLWNNFFYNIKKVRFFEGLNDEMLDEMCDWLKPIIYMEKSLIMRQGHPIKEVFFIMRGNLSIKSADGATLAPLNSGDYCGVELLIWAAIPNNSKSSVLPISNLTIETLTVVEAFTLKSDELKALMKNLHMLRGEKLQHELKSHSQQSKLEAACHIQAAWRQHRKWKPTLSKPEDVALVMESTSSSFHPSNYGSKFANIAKKLQIDSPRSQTASLLQTASLGA